MKFHLTLFIFLVQCTFSNADALEKGFERLYVYDYFQAKYNFEKALKKRVAGAAYGLSIIYSSNNNPFYNLDSARAYILLSDTSLQHSSQKQLAEYLELGISATSVASIKDSICQKAFISAENSKSVEKLNHFISAFNFCQQTEQAVDLRNKAALDDAKKVNTSAAFQSYINTYPDAFEIKEARTLYEERLYEEITADKTLRSYKEYLKKYPNGPFRQQAEKMIYQLSTANQSIGAYENYVREYPNTAYTGIAWRELYKLAMRDFNEQSYKNFKQKYPDYPYMDELEQDYHLMNSELLAFRKNELWGYLNEDGKEIIKPAYEEVMSFTEGLAAVRQNGKFGYINKSAKTIIPFQYDEAEPFKNMAAVVTSGEKVGLIATNGDLLIPFMYDEISDPSEGICSVIKDDLSGYIERSGKKITECVYDFAGDFSDGFAVIGMDEKFGIIRNNGMLAVKPEYDQLLYTGNNLYRARLNNKWGIINNRGEVKVPFAYSIISEFSEGKALVAKNGKCGFINEEGKLMVPINYTYNEGLLNTAKFTNGYVLIRQKTKSVLVDSTGNKVNISGFEDVGLLSNGMMPVKKNKKWGYATLAGKVNIPCKYQYAGPFEGNYAKIALKNLTGIIDTAGIALLPPVFEDILITPTCFITREHGLSGVHSLNGTMLLPREFDKINFISSKTAEAIKEDKKTLINIATGRVILKDN